MEHISPERAFGLRIRSLRRARSWTQDEVAQWMTAAGYPMHQTTVAKIESGSRPTSVGEVDALASIFGKSVASLFTDGEPESRQEEVARLRQNKLDKERQMMESMRMLNLAVHRYLDDVAYAAEAHNTATRLVLERERRGERWTWHQPIPPILVALSAHQFHDHGVDITDDKRFAKVLRELKALVKRYNLPWDMPDGDDPKVGDGASDGQH